MTYSVNQYHVVAPGVGFSIKSVDPGTVVAGGTVQVVVKVNVPAASDATFSDAFPFGFTLVNNQVTLERYVGDELMVTQTLTVSVQQSGAFNNFTITPSDAPDILTNLDSQTWFLVKYNLQTPTAGGQTYTLPAAKISYTHIVP